MRSLYWQFLFTVADVYSDVERTFNQLRQLFSIPPCLALLLVENCDILTLATSYKDVILGIGTNKYGLDNFL